MAIASDYDLPVTDAEYAALIAGDQVTRNIAADATYQITPRDREIRSRADAAMKSAKDRMDAWHRKWEQAATPQAKAVVEAQAEQEEARLRTYRVVVPKNRKSNHDRTQFAAAELDLKPTAEMAANATRGLELREKHGKGGTAVGVARARDIKNRANLSPSTVKRMHSFFSRHEGNQKGGEDDAGYIAWLLWGGDAGKAWAARKSEQLDKNESARFSHDIRLPRGKRRLNIDEAHAALAQMGYKLGTVRYDPAAGGSVYKVTQPNGSVIDMPAAKLTDFIYEKAKHMKSGTKAAFAANNVDLWNFLSKSDFVIARQNANDLANLKKYASMALTMPDFTPPAMQQHGPSLHDMAKDTLADIKKWEEAVYRQKNRAPWARTGARSDFASAGEVADFFKTLADVERAEMRGDTAKMRTLLQSVAAMVQRDRAKLPSDALAYYDSLRKKAGMSRRGVKAAMSRWVERHSGGWGDLSQSYHATINGIDWQIVMDASTGKAMLMRSSPSGPKVVKEGAVEQLKQYAETIKASRAGAKAAFAEYNTVQAHEGYADNKFYVTYTDANGGNDVFGPFNTMLEAKSKASELSKRHGAKLITSRAGAKAAFAHPDDAQITSTQLIRGNGRKYEILSRKPASAEARAQLGQTDWLDIRGANGAQYIVQVFNNGMYRVLSSNGKAWQGRILASRAGAKAAFAKSDSTDWWKRFKTGNWVEVYRNGSPAAYGPIIFLNKYSMIVATGSAFSATGEFDVKPSDDVKLIRATTAAEARNAGFKIYNNLGAEQVVHNFGDGWEVVERHSGYTGRNELVLRRRPAQGHAAVLVASIAEAKTKHDAITNWVFRATVEERRPNEWVIKATPADGGYGLGGRGGKPFATAQAAQQELKKMQDAYRKKAGMSRAGAKAAFSESAAWIAKYLPALNQWWRDRTDHPTDLDASSDRWEIEGVLDDVAEHCREAVPREAKPSWYAAALRDVKKIPHSRKASMKSHFAVKKSVSGTLVTLVPKAKGSGWKSYYAEWPSAKDARVTHHGVLVERDDGRVTLTHTSGQVVSEGNAGFGSMSSIRMSRAGAKAAFALSGTYEMGGRVYEVTGLSGGMVKFRLQGDTTNATVIRESEFNDMVQNGIMKKLNSRAGAKSDGLTLAQRIAVEHDAKRMAAR